MSEKVVNDSDDVKTVTINDYSNASYYVEQKYNDITLGNGTCFFYKYKNIDYLITNWHIVTGKKPDTQKLIRADGFTPDKLAVYLFDGNSDYAEWIIYEIDLYLKGKVWYEIRENNLYVDVVAIPVEIPKSKFLYFCINELEEPFNESTRPEVSGDVYVLGYPFGKTGGLYLPIWKRGSIASEPDVDINDMPYFYVDTASRPGMSGSPVIMYNPRPVSIIGESSVSSHFTKLIGVYSGRFGDPYDIESQLGRVWKAKVIESIVDSNH